MLKIETWRRKDAPDIAVTAVRLNEENAALVADWCRGELIEEIDPEFPEEHQPGINVWTMNGVERASLHMYVVKYGNNFFVAHNRVFETKFEPANREAPPLESAGDTRKQFGFIDPGGVKGMKWGVRKESPPPGGARRI